MSDTDEEKIYNCDICSKQILGIFEDLYKTCQLCDRKSATGCCLVFTGCQSYTGVCKQCIIKWKHEINCSNCLKDMRYEMSRYDGDDCVLDDMNYICIECEISFSN